MTADSPKLTRKRPESSFLNSILRLRSSLITSLRDFKPTIIHLGVLRRLLNLASCLIISELICVDRNAGMDALEINHAGYIFLCLWTVSKS